MKTAKHLDWLSITIGSEQNWRNFLPFTDLYIAGRGRHGYAHHWIDRGTGASIETGADRADMGTHVTLSGSVLSALRDKFGATDDGIVGRIQEWDGKVSRVDLAIDMFGVCCNPACLNAALLNKEAKISARTWRFIDGHSNGINGATIDTGSTASDRRFRFYDKAAEQRIKDGEAWVRLEMQLRRLYARSTVSACIEHGTAETVSASIGNYLKWSDAEYQAAIAGNSSFLPPIPRKESKRQQWLLGQVAKALADEYIASPDFPARFNQAVEYWIDERTKAAIDKSSQSDIS